MSPVSPEFHSVVTVSTDLNLVSDINMGLCLYILLTFTLQSTNYVDGNQEASESNLCKYFVSIHGQHKIRGIRDASSSGCCRSSLF